MILYDLICNNDHTFESWFRNGAAAEKVLKAHQSPCPVCASTKVRKAPMAPRVAKQDTSIPSTVAASGGDASGSAHKPLENVAQAMEKAAAALAELRDTIEKSFEHVGEKFPEEARRIHYGEAQERPIYGDATHEDAKALTEEGIKIAALPWPKRRN